MNHKTPRKELKEVDRYKLEYGGFRDYEKSHPRYRSEWRKVRKFVLARDDYTCMNCGVTQEDLLKDPTGSTAYDYLNVCHVEDKEDICPEALITLCRNCHKILDKMWSKGLPFTGPDFFR